MAAGGTGVGDRRGDDVLRRLRLGTASEHQDVERTLDLLDAGLDRDRLTAILDRMHGFWVAAEAGLDRWAAGSVADARAVDWPRRRRAASFAADLHALGSAPSAAVPELPPLDGTDEALGRLYVLEGSTLGGVFIDRHLAALPALADVRVAAFSPYGEHTGSMWAAFRRVTREHVTAGGDAAVMVDAARATFAALAAWCRPVAPALSATA
ncbi:biliverdin-producing heme oxygenase [Blastococcus haudaquaticus]|uniref:Heme oxygenase n=1 Tax=Blastococcus haudaquaticus TaxID=1938745 RepID=A0A286H5B4_9ACTN|nr:biliverdin-producing heme oxygenase [Blastococcus haudaquaticus]SOE02509.1 Heme oxygenase [Blastococcus haudaquaticus]